MRNSECLRLSVDVSGADGHQSRARARLISQERQELIPDASAGLMQGGSVGADLDAAFQLEFSEFDRGVKFAGLIHK